MGPIQPGRGCMGMTLLAAFLIATAGLLLSISVHSGSRLEPALDRSKQTQIRVHSSVHSDLPEPPRRHCQSLSSVPSTGQ